MLTVALAIIPGALAAITLTVGDLTEGQPVALTVGGVRPGESVRVVYSASAGPGLCPAALGGACLGVRAPVLGSLTLTGGLTGEASGEAPDPGTEASSRCYQAAVVRGTGGSASTTSPVVCDTVGPRDTDGDGVADDLDLPTLANLWAGQAVFEPDADHGPFGGSFAMHFLSTWWVGSTLHAWYIDNYTTGGIGRSATGLATSTDGLTFTDHGTVLDIGGGWQWVYDASTDLSHAIGRSDSGGWSANTSDDAAGHLSYGPYVSDLPEGPMTVSFQLLIDDNSADAYKVVTLDVYDVTTGTILAADEVLRTEFDATWTPQIFNLEYDQVAGHVMEFRVYWHDIAYIRHDLVSLSQGHSPFSDDRLASFPGVWVDGSDHQLVYEAAGTDASWPGDVSLATSVDGTTWIKDAGNPVLRHLTSGWESVNIGTPSLWHDGTQWYLFYHGFDGTDVQIGLATGTDLTALTRYSGNPILRTSTAGWDAGTVGKRSIIEEDGVFYMAFEGSTDGPFDTADWSTGLARSTDLYAWEKYANNPVLPVTSSSFGYDGPEFVRTPDGVLHLYYREPGNQTYRATLVWAP